VGKGRNEGEKGEGGYVKGRVTILGQESPKDCGPSRVWGGKEGGAEMNSPNDDGRGEGGDGKGEDSKRNEGVTQGKTR